MTELPARTLRLATESRFENVALLAAAATGVCEEIGWSGEARAEIELCVVEAVNNCIEHAYRGEPGHEVEVTLRADAERLSVEIADTGPPCPTACSTARARN